MNLEKAIKKNFFESTNIFDALINAKTETSENQNAKGLKFLSPVGSFKKHGENQNSESVVKNVKETQSPAPSTRAQNNETSIFKLANKIKNIKEKNKKLTAKAKRSSFFLSDDVMWRNSVLFQEHSTYPHEISFFH